MNWVTDKFKQLEKDIMSYTTDNASNTTVSSGGSVVTTGVINTELPITESKSVPIGVATTDDLTALENKIVSQIGSIVQTAIKDATSGNFSGIISDAKTAAINDGIQDAVSATRVLEQSVMDHIATLGTSNQLDVAKGKIIDAFMWVEKHLGVH